jgi:hypothetical protein
MGELPAAVQYKLINIPQGSKIHDESSPMSSIYGNNSLRKSHFAACPIVDKLPRIMAVAAYISHSYCGDSLNGRKTM